ncbi:MAG: hypothetical protein ABIY48_11255 [Acidimicrobiales bacterium]
MVIEPDAENGLDTVSAAQCQQIRAVSPRRIVGIRGNVGSTVVMRLRETIAIILDLP